MFGASHNVYKVCLNACEGIEAWTFEQNEGEAVLIPAGCPYQVRNLKVCLKHWFFSWKICTASCGTVEDFSY
jgi:hypothetical protein